MTAVARATARAVRKRSIARRRAALRRLQDGCCFWCEHPLHDDATFDHFVPRAQRGGAPGHFNYVLAHALCNRLKGDRLPSRAETVRFEALMAQVPRRGGQPDWRALLEHGPLPARPVAPPHPAAPGAAQESRP